MGYLAPAHLPGDAVHALNCGESSFPVQNWDSALFLISLRQPALACCANSALTSALGPRPL